MSPSSKSPPHKVSTNHMELTVPKPLEVAEHSVEDHSDAEPSSEDCACVAQVMNSETFLCKIGDFLKDYGPVQVSKEDVLKCKEHLVGAHLLDHSQGAYVFSDYQPPASTSQVDQATTFEVSRIIKAIFDYANSVSKKRNLFTPKFVPANQRAESGARTNYRAHGCIVEDKNYVGVSLNNNIIVGKGFAKHGNWDDHIILRQELVGDCSYLLYDDPRRLFIYGITMENRRMSVWYLSRSHSVKSISFDWVSDDADRFIEIYLAFAFATPAELGVDPLVHKAHVNPRSKNSSERPQQYIYECQPQLDYANSGTGKTRYYKTMYSLTPGRPDHIYGRMTRIWQVIEVDNIQNAKKIPGAKPVILKDVWLDVTRKTEAENMDLIFEAVDKFVADAQERYPSSEGLRQFMAADPRFEHFDQQTKLRLEHLLMDKRYRSLFLAKRYAWKGEKTKKLSENVKRPVDPIFVSRRSPVGRIIERAGEVPVTAVPRDNASLDREASLEEAFAQQLVSTDAQNCAFVQTQQCRFVYEEVCSRLWDLPTLGDVVDVLRQSLDALQVLWCAGWVHRDISSGNILALPVGKNFEVRLVDLEFAQPNGRPAQKSDPRIGTPYFMPFEIMRREYLFHGLYSRRLKDETFANQLNLPGGKSNPDYQRFANYQRFYGKTFTTLPANATVHIPLRNAAVSHNYQHDLESLWWVTLYYITTAVGHTPSFLYASKIFTNKLVLTSERYDTFMCDIEGPLDGVILPGLRAAFPDPINTLREELHARHIARALFGQLNLPESYSEIHAIFATEFDKLLESNVGNWKQTEIVRLNPKDDSRKRALEETLTQEDGPAEPAKRRRVEE